jgi:hypothetical protein
MRSVPADPGQLPMTAAGTNYNIAQMNIQLKARLRITT